MGDEMALFLECLQLFRRDADPRKLVTSDDAVLFCGYLVD